MAELAFLGPRESIARPSRIPAGRAFAAREPLTGADRDLPRSSLLGSLANFGAAVRDTVRGAVKAVRAPERETINTPIPPEVVAATHGLAFRLGKS